MWRDLLVLFAAGGLGTSARYGAGVLAQHHLPADFPYGTLLVNVGGSLLIGVLAYLAVDADVLSHRARLAWITGFCGAFTTFSTFSYETARAFQAGDHRVAALNIVLNVALCLGATFAGFAAASRLAP